MADSFEIAYLYARVCGAFSSMHLGVRGVALARESSLPSIWKQYFALDIPDKPEAWLLATLERKVVERSMERFMALAGPILETDAFIAALTAKYEISAVKGMLYRLTAAESKPESLFFESKVTEKALFSWPKLDEMFSGTDYAWIDDVALADIGAAENRLDKQYYTKLWQAIQALPRKKRGNIPALLLREISYQNLAWALRVRRYYGYGRERTIPLLADIAGEDVTSLALGTFELDIDNPGSFTTWPFKKFLAGQTASRLDIPLLENRLQRDLFSSVRRSMHMFPFGYTPLYCYFKMLEAEASLILGILEGIRLKAPAEEKIDLAWALSGDTV
jgi:hypothetical protein